MPKLVRLVAQGEPVIRGHDLAVLADRREHRKIGARAGRADLGYFRRTEAAREGELAFVSHVLAAKHQNRMLLESATHCRVCRIVGLNLAKRHATHLGGKARPEREDFHRLSPPSLVLDDFHPRCVSWQAAADDGARPSRAAPRGLPIPGRLGY